MIQREGKGLKGMDVDYDVGVTSPEEKHGHYWFELRYPHDDY